MRLPLSSLASIIHLAEVTADTAKQASATISTFSPSLPGAVFAQVPTTAGQIGINPVESDLGPASTYIGQIFGIDTLYLTLSTYIVSSIVQLHTINVDTAYITMTQGVTGTAWIGVNTKYLTLESINPTSTSTVQLVVATAPADANGQSIGDISVILSEGLANTLQASVDDALSTCKIPPVLKRGLSDQIKRDTTSAFVTCLATAGAEAAAKGGIFDAYVSAETLASLGVTMTAETKALLAPVIAALTAPEVAGFILWMAIAATATAVGYEGTKLPGLDLGSPTGTVGKINIPAAGFGATSQPVQASKCDSTSVKNSESPLCLDYDCLSQDNKTCSVSPNEQCPCLMLLDPKFPQYGNITYMNEQQILIESFIAAIATFCSFVTTTYTALASPNHSLLDQPSGPQIFCTCGIQQIDVILGGSGTVTTTYCSGRQTMPAGYTTIANTRGIAVSTTSALPAVPHPSKPSVPSTTSMVTKTTAVGNPHDPASCGAPFC